MVAISRAPRAPAVESWPDAPGVLETSGDLAGFVVAYEARLPGARSHAYVDPIDQDAERLVAAIHTVLAGDLEAAAGTLHELGYDLLAFHDTATGGEHLVLHERLPSAHC